MRMEVMWQRVPHGWSYNSETVRTVADCPSNWNNQIAVNSRAKILTKRVVSDRLTHSRQITGCQNVQTVEHDHNSTLYTLTAVSINKQRLSIKKPFHQRMRWASAPIHGPPLLQHFYATKQAHNPLVLYVIINVYCAHTNITWRTGIPTL